jgi:hypothetical protein
MQSRLSERCGVRHQYLRHPPAYLHASECTRPRSVPPPPHSTMCISTLDRGELLSNRRSASAASGRRTLRSAN